MQRQQIQPYLFALGMSLALSACFTEPNFPDKPEISFIEIPKYPLEAGRGVGKGKRDSVVISVNFKDGDGNLGNDIPVAKGDSTRYASNGGWGNYRIRTFRLVNGKYEEAPATVENFLLFPDLAKGKPKGPISGPLHYSVTFQYGTSFRIYPTKFRVTIRDRNLNESNEIETDTINLPFPR
ncbi:hypothetical protein [Spirosoma arcticum]